MTKAQKRRQVVRILKEWRSRLYIDHIDIEIDWEQEPEDEDAMAAVYPSNLYDIATIRFHPDWEEFDVPLLNRIVVHELLHVVFRDYSQAIRSIGVTGALNADARALWYDRCHDAEEGLIDRLANRYVELGGVVE